MGHPGCGRGVPNIDHITPHELVQLYVAAKANTGYTQVWNNSLDGGRFLTAGMTEIHVELNIVRARTLYLPYVVSSLSVILKKFGGVLRSATSSTMKNYELGQREIMSPLGSASVLCRPAHKPKESEWTPAGDDE